MEQIRTFISYAHRDEFFFKDFVENFKVAIQNRPNFDWETWDDRNIHVGTYWDDTIQSEIKSCNVALLLVSMSFMASKYIREYEFAAFRDEYENRGILIVPIVLAPCDFEHWSDIAKIQFFKPQGADYGRPDKKNDFTYADLVKQRPDGTIFPNPEADRYVLHLTKKIEDGFLGIKKKQKQIEEEQQNIIASTTPKITVTPNILKDAPTPRPYFTGRDEEIAEFKRAIDGGANLILVDGPGGIGKTQFVSRCIELFVPSEKIVWFECNPASHFDTLISGAGYPELLTGTSKSDRDKFSAFKEKIENDALFLFLDNFQDTNENPVFKDFLVFIQNYLKKGCIVVMDRDNLRSIDLAPRRIHLEGLKDKQLEYARKLIENSYKNKVLIADNELKDLCEQLHGHPLAIDLAMLLLSEGETRDNIVTKIGLRGDSENVNERLLNAIFNRPDAKREEQDFITQFSVFIGKVSDSEIKAVLAEDLIRNAKAPLLKKNLLTYSMGFYETHPLVRELCYQKLAANKGVAVILHTSAAEFYLSQRKSTLNPALEEQIFYHLSKSDQWERMDKEIEDNGREFIKKGQLGLVKKLVERLENIGIDKPIFSILNGDIAEIQGRWDEAQSYYNIARNNEADKKIKIEGMIKFGEMIYRKGNVKEALPYFEMSYKLALGNNFLREQARAANDIGIIKNTLGDLKSSLKWYNEALITREDLDDDEDIAISLNNVGLVYIDMGEYNVALKFFYKARDLSISRNITMQIANSFCSISNVFAEKAKYVEAMSYLEKCYSIYEELGSRCEISNVLRYMGNVHHKQKKIQEALANIEKSRLIDEELGNKVGIAQALNFTARIRRDENNFSEATKLFKQSMSLYEEMNMFPQVASTCNSLAFLFHKQLNYPDCVLYSFRSIALYTKIGNKKHAANSMALSVEVRDKIGLDKFRDLASNAYNNLEKELNQYLQLNVLLLEPIRNTEPKIGRNDPCGCGSGKKYKACHGRNVSRS